MKYVKIELNDATPREYEVEATGNLTEKDFKTLHAILDALEERVA